MVDPEEAVNRGILDTAAELYIDSHDRRLMPLHEAYEAGLIEAVEQQPSAAGPQPSASRYAFPYLRKNHVIALSCWMSEFTRTNICSYEL